MNETMTKITRPVAAVLFAAAAVVVAASGVAAGTGGEPAFTRTQDAGALEWGPCPAFMPESCAIAVLHGSPSKPDADVFFRLPGNTSVPEHWHESPERMVLVSGRMRVNYAGQDPVLLDAGTYAYGPAKRPHSATCVSAEDCVLFIAFAAPIDAYPADD